MRGVVIGCTVLAAVALAAACARYGAAGAGSAAGVPLENTEWALVELGGQPARTAPDGAPTLRLDSAQRRASGNTGCNSFGGEYELSGGTLRFGVLATTRRACVDPELNQQEAAFLRALAETRGWRVAGDTLVLSGPAGPLARFAARAPR